MRRRLLALAVLTTALIAAAPGGPSPVITLDGVSVAAKLSPELRAALAPKVKALNAVLEKIVAFQAGAANATGQQRAHPHEAMKGIHQQCTQLHNEIIKQLDPQQRAAFREYLHGQMKAAGIQMAHPDHGHGTHPDHGQRPHPPHGERPHPPHAETHGDAMAAAACA